MRSWLYLFLPLTTVLFAGLALQSLADDSQPSLQEQRQLYQKALTATRRTGRVPAEFAQPLSDYPLWPYLEKAELQQRFGQLPEQAISQFLIQYENTVAAAQLRSKWLDFLAKKRQWDLFNRYYDDSSATTELKCYRLEALHRVGQAQQALDQTATLWLNGQSLPDACNRPFALWEQAGLKSDELVWQRLLAAVDRGNTTLAHYLTRKAGPDIKPYARRLMRLHRHPNQLAKWLEGPVPANRYNATIATYGLQRLAARDYALADLLWQNNRAKIGLNAQQNAEIRQSIGRQIISSADNAMAWLLKNDPNAEDSYLLEWRIRLALKQQQWAAVNNWISLLPDAMQQTPRWQYWLARSYVELPGGSDQAKTLLSHLALKRNYYGFLAASQLQQDYGFNDQPLPLSSSLPAVASTPAIERARELYELNDLTAARREWRNGTASFDQTQLIAATALAHQWGWHPTAITTTIQAKHWNDLSVRFPLAYQQQMTDSARSANIEPQWLYAIARQESAFASDARSAVGARGLLQLMPATAEGLAKNLGVKFDIPDLYKPEKNIQLGSQYLKQLLDAFDGNTMLATAAYNAGPNRVKRWLNTQPLSIDADIWIETLPYYETREYVQNVMAFSVIYGYRMGQRASTLLPRVDQMLSAASAEVKIGRADPALN